MKKLQKKKTAKSQDIQNKTKKKTCGKHKNVNEKKYNTNIYNSQI